MRWPGRRGKDGTDDAFRPFLGDGIATRAMDGFTGGVFLTGLALLLGAQPWQIGLLASVPFLGQLMQLPAVMLLERYPDRQRVCVLASLTARLLLLAMGFLPLLAGNLGVPALLVLFAALSVVAAFGGAAWNSWLRDILPRARLGEIFSRRLTAQALTGTVIALLAGVLLDQFTGRGADALGFAVLYTLGTASGLAGVHFLRRMPPPKQRPPRPAGRIGPMLAVPFRDVNFRLLMRYNAAWGFATNFAAPFVTVYMLTVLQLPFVLLGLFTAAATLASVVALPVWGRLADRYGNKPVLAICTPVFALSLLLWVVAVRDTALATIAIVLLIHVVNGLAASGLDLASNNILLKLAPEDDAAAYLASASITRAAASAAGPVLGSTLLAWAAARGARLDITWISPAGSTTLTPVSLHHFDFLFLVAALLGLYAAHRLAGVREEGEAPREEVLRALRSEVAQVNSMMALRRFAHVGGAAALLVRTAADRARAPGKGPLRPRQAPPPEVRRDEPPVG